MMNNIKELIEIPSKANLAERLVILKYHPNYRDSIRRAYIRKGPSEPRNHNFPQTEMSDIVKVIIEDLNGDYFSIFVNKSRHVSCKEQMALILCYVDRRGFISYIRGQCYDGASNMQGKFNGLKVLIQREKRSAHSALKVGELQTSRGLNQELGLVRRWGSHFKSFINFILLFDLIIDVLDTFDTDAESSDER
ncbi:hypothetical protein CDL12_23248 [Handroanthus impetiginosus]|uniref:DUF4371 domain-containing protein n=1 Tax=Handroanthus impetiginosus TaxID=429701 RepID=A0A2G9GFZ9_9LAMI|nr:hypothetical protein CDL12_23248 [Handroanthus impetiginosus]